MCNLNWHARKNIITGLNLPHYPYEWVCARFMYAPLTIVDLSVVIQPAPKHQPRPTASAPPVCECDTPILCFLPITLFTVLL